jgi:ABC transporter, phosphonate, periplasmic substrate-binding protein
VSARLALAGIATVAAVAIARPAAAQGAGAVTVGLYAPTAPFAGTGDRVSFVNAVADHLAGAAGGRKVSGKVFSSAGAFAGAIKKGEIQFAVVDAPYAAALGLPYKVLGAAVRSGSTSGPWVVVAPGGVARLGDLRGKKIVVPTVGAKEAAFVTNTLLEGEVDATFFGQILEAADARSAITMVSGGKADAALVPGGVDVPGGLTAVAQLHTVGWPMFVALPGAPDDLSKAFGGAIGKFSASGAFTGFIAADASLYRGLAGSFSRDNKRGPMAVPPPARLTVRELLEGRTFTTSSSNVLDLVEAPRPVPRPAAGGARTGGR